MKKTLNEYYNDFLYEKMSYCEEKTIIYYKENLLPFVEYCADEEPTKHIYINYIVKLRGRNLKNSSIRTYCRAIKVFSRWLYENEYIDKDFTHHVKLPRDDHNMIVPLSSDEVKKIDDYLNVDLPFPSILDIRNYIIFHLMLDEGLRLSEVINLKTEDIDFDNNIIFINNSKYNKSRAVPLIESLKQYIFFYLDEGNCFNSKFLLIKHDNTYEAITKHTVKNFFRKLKTMTCIERLHPHLLRHTFATSYIMNGGDLEKLRILLGHSDYNVTRNYLHISSQQMILKYDIYKLDDVYFERRY